MVTGRGNPCDAWAALEIKGVSVVSEIMTALLKDKNVDMLVVTTFPVGAKELSFSQKETFGNFVKKYKKPIFYWTMGACAQSDDAQIDLNESGIPLFFSID